MSGAWLLDAVLDGIHPQSGAETPILLGNGVEVDGDRVLVEGFGFDGVETAPGGLRPR